MRTLLGIELLLVSMLSASTYAQTTEKRDEGQRPALTLTVESEGPGGMYAQSGTDLSGSEVSKLRSLIEKNLLRSHRLVPSEYTDSHLFLSIVAMKLTTPGGKTYFAASSALSVGTVQGNLGSLTHNVIVQSDLTKMAAAVSFYQSAFELQAGT